MYGMWQRGRDPAEVNATRVLSMVEPGAAIFNEKLHGELSTAAFDNYFVRVLGGNDVYWLPAGSVNRTHLETAKQVLQRYQVIMTLDSFDEDALQMSELLGWAVTALDMPEGGAWQQLRSTATGGDLPFPFAEEQLQALSTANGLDYELLCFARSMRVRRVDEARRLRSSKLARSRQSQEAQGQGQSAAVAAGKADWRSESAMGNAQEAQAAELDETYLGWMEQAAQAQQGAQAQQAAQAQPGAQAQQLRVARSSATRGDGTWTDDDVPQVFVGDDGPSDEEPDEAPGAPVQAPAPAAAGAVAQAPAPVNTDAAPVQAPAPLATDANGNPIVPAVAAPVAADSPVAAGPPVLSDGGLGAAAAANGASAAAQGAVAAGQGALGTAAAPTESQEPEEEPRLLSDGGVAAAAAAMGTAASASPAIARGEEPAQQQQPEAPALTGDPAADAANKAFADAAAAAAKTHAEEAARNEASIAAAAAAKAAAAAHPNIISDDPGSCRTIITTVNDQWCQVTCQSSCPSTHCACDS